MISDMGSDLMRVRRIKRTLDRRLTFISTFISTGISTFISTGISTFISTGHGSPPAGHWAAVDLSITDKAPPVQAFVTGRVDRPASPLLDAAYGEANGLFMTTDTDQG